MKRTTKIATAAVALTMPVALMLAGCSGDSGGNGGDGDDNTLTVWTWDPAFNIYAMQEAEKVYQKDHPGFTLDIVETPWDDLQTKLTTLAQSQEFDELPDILLMQNNAFQKNLINYPDVFSDITDSGIDFSQFPQAVTDYSSLDGANYGVPFDAGTAIGAYRTDVLAAAGYTIEDFTDITWSEFQTKAEDVLAASAGIRDELKRALDARLSAIG